jgi:hypothetical protein
VGTGDTTTEQVAEVLGVQASVSSAFTGGVQQQAGTEQALPSAVDAGATGDRGGDVPAGHSLLGLLLVLLGGASARLAWTRRARG